MQHLEPAWVRERGHITMHDCDWIESSEGDLSYCATDQVRFGRRDGRKWALTPLAEVPPLVFSEAMRDVDLFVGVTSIAADDDWQDRGDDRFRDYRHRAAFACKLEPSTKTRRSVRFHQGTPMRSMARWNTDAKRPSA